MKTVRLLISIFTASAVLGACREGTPTSESLRSTLEASVCNGKILFGQQDALLYGHSWRASENDSLDRSDIESVCGKHPAVLGLDLGGIESGSDRNLDGNAFSLMRTAALRQYERGGIVTLSWHPENPLTGHLGCILTQYCRFHTNMRRESRKIHILAVSLCRLSGYISR